MSVLPQQSSSTYQLPDGREIAVVHTSEAATLWAEIAGDQHSPYRFAAAGLGEGDVIIDVGAHIGLASLCFADQAPGARIVAVEPAPRTYACLHTNFERHLPRAVALEKAVGAAPGQATLTFHPYVASASTIHPDATDDAQNMEAYFVNANADDEGREVGWSYFNVIETVQVDVTTLTEIVQVQDVHRIGLLKVDVERGELEVLRGLEEAAWPIVQRVFLEVHDLDGRLGTIVGMLAGRGFQAVVSQSPVFRGGSVYQVLATRL